MFGNQGFRPKLSQSTNICSTKLCVKIITNFIYIVKNLPKWLDKIFTS